MTQWTLPAADQLAKQVQEETIKHFRRISHGTDLIYRPREPQVVIWTSSSSPRALISRLRASRTLPDPLAEQQGTPSGFC